MGGILASPHDHQIRVGFMHLENLKSRRDEKIVYNRFVMYFVFTKINCPTKSFLLLPFDIASPVSIFYITIFKTLILDGAWSSNIYCFCTFVID